MHLCSVKKNYCCVPWILFLDFFLLFSNASNKNIGYFCMQKQWLDVVTIVHFGTVSANLKPLFQHFSLYQAQLISGLHFIIFLGSICCVKDYIFLICYVLCLVLYKCNHIFFIISLFLFIMLMYICTTLVLRVDPKISTRIIVVLTSSLKRKIRCSLTAQILLL